MDAGVIVEGFDVEKDGGFGDGTGGEAGAVGEFDFEGASEAFDGGADIASATDL
jgi:hypothetical protein